MATTSLCSNTTMTHVSHQCEQCYGPTWPFSVAQPSSVLRGQTEIRRVKQPWIFPPAFLGRTPLQSSLSEPLFFNSLNNDCKISVKTLKDYTKSIYIIKYKTNKPCENTKVNVIFFVVVVVCLFFINHCIPLHTEHRTNNHVLKKAIWDLPVSKPLMDCSVMQDAQLLERWAP